ncbi:MAG: hypothetical protein P8R42_19300 [Candidatus Binatia bacterium]|nr:hypothetical protein [Candidatus Binatia bacterium]
MSVIDLVSTAPEHFDDDRTAAAVTSSPPRPAAVATSSTPFVASFTAAAWIATCSHAWDSRTPRPAAPENGTSLQASQSPLPVDPGK